MTNTEGMSEANKALKYYVMGKSVVFGHNDRNTEILCTCATVEECHAVKDRLVAALARLSELEPIVIEKARKWDKLIENLGPRWLEDILQVPLNKRTITAGAILAAMEE